ncbi:SGNH/GDSL hydrolase family protein [Pseudoalteromonas sp. TB41]|uniref:SGNH/GDSL hydrolase family protein n=1 Tax=Pseudoalteromonas sp. TB41 TaxID=985149 RepID=UPI000412D188|nr:SGNH/GDSL hydrolase family protein [Pseudoalteromonas sp. TB41]
MPKIVYAPILEQAGFLKRKTADEPQPVTFPVDDVVIFGASIMEQSFSGANQQVTSNLYATKGATVNVHERATSGDNTTVMKSRLPAIISEFQPNASRTLVVIHGGGNDQSQSGPYPGGATTMEENMRSMLQDLKDAGFKIALSTITYRIPPASNPSELYNENVINPLIAEFADVALDMYSLTFDNQGTWFEVDGIHPNSTGEDMTRNYIVDNTFERFSNLGPIPQPVGWNDVVLQFGLINVYPDGSNEFSIDSTKSNIKNVDLTVVEGAEVTLLGSGGHSDELGRGNVNDPTDDSISLTNNSGLLSYVYKQDGTITVDLSAATLNPTSTYTVGLTASRNATDTRNNDIVVGGVTKVINVTASPAEIVEFTGVLGSDLIATGITSSPTGGTGFAYIGITRITRTA